MNKKIKYILTILTFFIIAICIMVIAVQFRMRGSISIKAVQEENIAVEEPIFYNQKDTRWAKQQLGNSIYTMESSGCLVACIAAAIQMSDIVIANQKEEQPDWMMNPGELNQYFSQNNVYDSQGNLQWQRLDELEYFHVDVYEEVTTEQIIDCLRQGRYPVVRVRVKGYGNFHYVLVVALVDGIFYCIDPLNPEEELLPLSEYNNRVYAMRCVHLES